MNNVNFFTLISFFIFLSACQIQEKASSGGLIAGHVSVTNEFTLLTPTADTYVNAETIDFTITFPYPVTVTGAPRLVLTVGSTTSYAPYVSGDGTKSLIFRYTVLLTDEDSDGVAFSSLDLNGGTLTFSTQGSVISCNTTITAKTFSSVRIDNTAPTISAFTLSTLPGFYRVGAKLNFLMTFSEAVYVTGTPSIDLALTTGGTVQATYSGGTGTTSIAFSYTITSSAADTDGINSITSPVALNAGTIKDLAGNNATLTFGGLTAAVIALSTLTTFDGTVPYVVSALAPSNGTYLAAQNLDLQLTFDRAVTVTGSPYVTLTIGSTGKQAIYYSGSGTTVLTFRYTTIPGDSDSDGVAYATTITANGGTIIGTSAPLVSYFAQTANNSFSVPSTAGVLVGAIQPTATSISRNTDTTIPTWGSVVADDIWINGQTLSFTVGFNTNVWVSQAGGTPSLGITIGSTVRQATYLSGGNGQTSLVFTYTIQGTDYDNDGSIGIGNLSLNGGVIYDANSTNALLTMPVSTLGTTSVDGVAPTISSITAPVNNTYSTISGNDHTIMDFTITWSEAVNYSATGVGAVYIPIDAGGSATNAQYLSGNNTATIIHRPATLVGRNDTDGITLASPILGTATIKDQAGNTATVLTYTPPNTSSILIDTTSPTVSSIVPMADGSYGTGANLDFSVVFSENVTTNVSGGYPRIPITVGATTNYLIPTTNTTSTTHTFRYTILANETDADGVVMGNAVTTSGAGYAQDAGQNIVTGTFVPPSTPNVLVDAVAPAPTAQTSPANGTYQSGDILSFTVTFSENVAVTGTPQIQVAAQTGTLNFNYASGTGTSTLTFSYTVTSSDFDFDGLPSAIAGMTLNGGTIRDLSGNNSSLSFTVSQNLSSVFIAYPNTPVWTTNTFINKAASGGITLSSAGVVTTQACGTSTCRTFDGDDTLALSGAVNSVDTAFVVFTTPAAVAITNLFVNDFTLSDNTTNFNLTIDGTINLDGAVTSGTTHAVGMATSSTHIIQIDFTTAANFSAGDLISTGYTGAIGEVILVTGALSAPQKANILTYLNAKY